MFFRKRRFRVSTIGHRARVAAAESGRMNRWLKLLGLGCSVLIVAFVLRKYVVLIALNILAVLFTPVLPSIDNTDALLAKQSTIIYDREGNELYTIHGDENRFEIPLVKISPTLIQATIAAEDDNFYNHPGIDVDGIIRAALGELGLPYIGGGSTITQQFVKTAYLSPERSYIRKFKEWLLAIKLENNFSKDEILEMYLNRIPYGSNAYGIEAASETFFGKHASDLTLAESAILASLPQAPSRYSPYGPNKADLTGSCAGAYEQVTLGETIAARLTARGKVWVRVVADGKTVQEITASVGKTVDFTFAEKAYILGGNSNFDLAVGDLAIPHAEKATTVRVDLTRTSVQAALDADESVVTKKFACTSPDDPRYTAGRKDYVLGRMLKLGLITQDEYDTAWKETLGIKFQNYRESIAHAHFVMYVRDLLEESYGKDIIERGGLRVFTTLDPDLQKKAEEVVANHFPHTTNPDGTVTWQTDKWGATNASLLSIDPKTGQILAMVGSRDYFEKPNEKDEGNDGAVNLTLRPRQPGSSFKPIAYAAGFLAGYAPASVLWDVETDFGQDYKPKNFDGTFWGPISIRKALQNSRNIPAVKMAILAGEKSIVALAKQMGITTLASDGRYGPTIALGAGEVPMLELLSAYTVFANNGVKIAPTPFLKITDSSGRVIEEFEQSKNPPVALDPAAAYLVTDVLSDTSQRPASWNAYLALPDRPVAAKTGTANRQKKDDPTVRLPGDLWTVGYTPAIATAVWMGNNDSSPLWPNAAGLQDVAPMWRDFMRYATARQPIEKFIAPDTIIEKSVNRRTGKLPSSRTPVADIVTEKFAPWNVPLEIDDGYQTLTVDRVSGKLPTEFTPPEALVERTFVNLHSERPTDPNWETPVRNWIGRSTDSSSEIAYSAAPVGYDDVHTPASLAEKPSVSFIAPKAGATVRAGSIGVWVDTTAPHEIDHVEYYRDGELVATATAAPWKASVGLGGETGSTHTITATAFDKLYYSNSASITVTTGTDSTPPTVYFMEPTEGAKITAGETLAGTLTAYDFGGDVTSVIVRFDGEQIAEFKNPPYTFEIPFKTDAKTGTHTLTAIATDTDGQTSEARATIEIVAPKAETSATTPTTKNPLH